MAFLRSLFSGVSGLRNHQVMMDVIGNNIANINTVGFKGSRVTFSEMFAQTLRGATKPSAENGGSNPMQVGLGMKVNTADTVFSQGNIETTGVSTDLAIQGNGFFIVKKGGQTLYTRVGTFQLDSSGTLVNSGNGAILQGKLADAAGNVPTGTTLEDIKIALDMKAPAHATSLVKLSGNLNSAAATGDTSSASVTIFDSMGNQQTLTVEFTKAAGTNQWTWTASAPSPSTITSGGSGTISFNDDGSLATFAYNGGATALAINPNNGAANLSIDLNVGTPGIFTGITQTEGSSSITPREQNGYGSGDLSNISIDQNGGIQGTFSNGTVITLGQIMVAEFNNPSGLLREGDTMYNISDNSGIAAILTPGVSSQSKIFSGSLEQSNVDLADEFTKMITAQRGFQANAKVITTSDEFLNEVVNLKR
jgi:flagellar hook protein FlgE